MSARVGRFPGGQAQIRPPALEKPMSSRVLADHYLPHVVLIEGDGLKRLVRAVVDLHKDNESKAINALGEITKLPANDAKNLIDAEMQDRTVEGSALDAAIWRILS
jgi:hypothetical protein